MLTLGRLREIIDFHRDLSPDYIVRLKTGTGFIEYIKHIEVNYNESQSVIDIVSESYTKKCPCCGK